MYPVALKTKRVVEIAIALINIFKNMGACTNCKCAKAGRRCNSSCRCSRFKMCTNMEAMEAVDKVVLALETETSAAQVAGVPEHDDQLEYGANAAEIAADNMARHIAASK